MYFKSKYHNLIHSCIGLYSANITRDSFKNGFFFVTNIIWIYTWTEDVVDAKAQVALEASLMLGYYIPKGWIHLSSFIIGNLYFAK